MRHALALLVFAAGPALAQGEAPYRDDRSTPESLIESLYNAIDRHEDLCAWSYFRDGAAAPYEAFRDGYADTASVEVRVGETTSEGAAGSIHSAVPVALTATSTTGRVSYFVGCYRVVQVQPAIQEEPPFRPLQVEGGALRAVPRPPAVLDGCG